jgi:glyoxylase-like metal-dependent hydrolase (beta-lactamase superfamily II)
MHIQSIPMCMSTLMIIHSTCPLIVLGEGTGNNYAYLVSDDKTREAVIIDPAHPEEYVIETTLSVAVRG